MFRVSHVISIILHASFLAAAPFPNLLASTMTCRMDVHSGAGETAENLKYCNRYFPARSGISNAVENSPSSFILSNSGRFIDLAGSQSGSSRGEVYFRPIRFRHLSVRILIPIDGIRISVQIFISGPVAAGNDNPSFAFCEDSPKPVPEASAISLLAIVLLAMLTGAWSR